MGKKLGVIEPNKDTLRHIQLDVKDIAGASPKQLLKPKGKKRQDFFPGNSVINNFYNSQAVSGVSRCLAQQKARLNYGTGKYEIPTMLQWPDQQEDRTVYQDPDSFEPERRSDADFLD